MCTPNNSRSTDWRRSPEYDLLPWLASRGMPMMAYSPIEQGRLLQNARLQEIAAGLGATPAQVALAWVLRQEQVLAIPNAGSVAHVQENRAAAELPLSVSDWAALDAAFPLPGKRRPLEML
ncbi:aldo/keto reductase [Hymenobacter citatus]|uniref:aldo/keto reductase n=1 Tax=Hymenobacter citatus TaxID=2763506 RepID=UPI003CCD1A19